MTVISLSPFPDSSLFPAYSMARIMAVISMRPPLVYGSEPCMVVLFSPFSVIAAYPPGPGFPSHWAPVWMMMVLV